MCVSMHVREHSAMPMPMTSLQEPRHEGRGWAVTLARMSALKALSQPPLSNHPTLVPTLSCQVSLVPGCRVLADLIWCDPI